MQKLCVAGQVAIVNANGKVERSFEAHAGAVLGVRWSDDATGFATSAWTVVV